MKKTKTTIGIAFGGKSGEHKVSIQSAKTIIRALQSNNNKDKYEAIPIYIDLNGRWWPTEQAIVVLNMEETPEEFIHPNQGRSLSDSFHLPREINAVDIWFPVIHGPNGEDGTIQGLFQLMGKPFIGSGVLGSALGMDKIAMKSIFKSCNLPQVPYLELTLNALDKNLLSASTISLIKDKIDFPCFIKPANLGSSVGINKAYTETELIQSVKEAFYYDQRIVIEKNIKARELECAVIGKKDMTASVVGEISFQTDWFNYEAKYSEGLSHAIIPASISSELSAEVRRLSLIACKAINAYGLARVDFFYNEETDNLYINEINTLPGFTEKSMYPMLWKASGVNLDNLVRQIIKTARE